MEKNNDNLSHINKTPYKEDLTGIDPGGSFSLFKIKKDSDFVISLMKVH